MDDSNVENVVQQSTKYGKFQFIGTNRVRNQGHIEKLKKAFQEVGNLTKVQPILVNEKYEIIDGQHRFQAARELGEPIYFTMRKGLGIDAARSMNILQRGWTTDDFANSYAESGNKQYREYLRIREEYGFNHSITLIYLAGGEVPGLFSGFREGTFEIPDLPAAIKRLELLASVEELTPIARFQSFAVAFLYSTRVPGYSHKEFLKKVALFGESQLKHLNSIPDNQRMIEDVYNYSTRVGNRQRLY